MFTAPVLCNEITIIYDDLLITFSKKDYSRLSNYAPDFSPNYRCGLGKDFITRINKALFIRLKQTNRSIILINRRFFPRTNCTLIRKGGRIFKIADSHAHPHTHTQRLVFVSGVSRTSQTYHNTISDRRMNYDRLVLRWPFAGPRSSGLRPLHCW